MCRGYELSKGMRTFRIEQLRHFHYASVLNELNFQGKEEYFPKKTFFSRQVSFNILAGDLQSISLQFDYFNSLVTNKQTTKFSSEILKKC